MVSEGNLGAALGACMWRRVLYTTSGQWSLPARVAGNCLVHPD